MMLPQVMSVFDEMEERDAICGEMVNIQSEMERNSGICANNVLCGVMGCGAFSE